MDSCEGVVTIYSLWSGVVSLTPNPRPGGPGYPFLSVSSLLTSLACKALPAAIPTACFVLLLYTNCIARIVVVVSSLQVISGKLDASLQWRTQRFFRGGVSINSVEDRENGDLGVVAP